MPRSFFRDSIFVKGPAGAIPLAGAAVSFYQEAPPGAPFVPLPFPLYPTREDGSPLAQPYITGDLGEVEVWADYADRIRLVATKGGLVSADETVDLEWPPDTVATNDNISDAILAHEQKEDPHPQYLLESEADLLYLPIDYVPPDEYLTQDEGDLRYTPIGEAYTKAESDTRYEQLANKGQPSGYVPLDPGGLVPNQYLPPLAITDSYVVADEAEMLALDAQKGDVAIRVDEGRSYILGVEPPTVLANWYAMGGAGSGGNTSVIRDQEWAVSTGNTVALTDAPTKMLTVTRNGVAQSETLGHFTLSGSTLTFADAFEAGEYVTALYEIGTSVPVPVDSYTKAESDLRYVNVDGDTMTGDLTLDPFPGVFGTSILTESSLSFKEPGKSYWGFKIQGANGGEIYWGDGNSAADVILGREGALRLYLQATLRVENGLLIGGYSSNKRVDLSPDAGNTLEWRDNGFYSAGLAQAGADTRYVNVSGDTMTNSLIVNMNSSTSRTYYSDWGMWSRDTNQPNDCFVCTPYGLRFGDGATPLDTRIRRVGAAALQVEANAVGVGQGVTPAAWVNTYKAIQLGLGGAVIGPTDAANLFLNANSYQDGSGWKAINAGGGVTLQLGSGGTMTLFTAPSVAAGAAQTFTTVFSIDQNGVANHIGLGDNGGRAAQVAIRSTVDDNNAYQQLIFGRGVGAQANMWRIGQNIAGGSLNEFHIYDDGSATAAVKIARATRTVTFLPAAGNNAITLHNGPITPNGDLQGGTTLGSAGNRFSVAYVTAVRAGAAANLFLGAGATYICSDGDGSNYLGHPTQRFQSAYLVQAPVIGSSADLKENITPLDPAACVEAVLGTDWVEFDYKAPATEPDAPAALPVPEDETPERAEARSAADARAVEMYVEGKAAAAVARHQRGYVLGSEAHQTAEMFGLSDRQSASTHADLAVVACALQDALKRIAALEAARG